MLAILCKFTTVLGVDKPVIIAGGLGDGSGIVNA
jgi:hypothetical protein